MNNPNPFVPQGSLLEQQSKRRSRLKLGVLCVLAVGIAGLAAMLIQGCKREQDQDQNSPDLSQNTPQVDTNAPVETDTNQPPVEGSNATPEMATSQTPEGAPTTANTPPPEPAPEPAPAPAPTESEYVIVRGDTLGKIAKANGITLRALEDANPNVQPTRLHVGQKLVLPAGAATTGAGAAAETESGVAANTGGDEVYTVKSGDTLTRIARHFGTTVKALMAENNLTTTHIKVGKKLNIPAKPEAESAAPVNAPPTEAQPPTQQPQPEPATDQGNSAPPQGNAPGTAQQ
jgi:LysM repeat protein